jgi:hypothetical protein
MDFRHPARTRGPDFCRLRKKFISAASFNRFGL